MLFGCCGGVMKNIESRRRFGSGQMLNNHHMTSIRKHKFIGTQKHNSEAVGETSHEHVAKDSDGSTKDVSIKNIQGTTLHTTGGDKGSIGGDDTKEKRRVDMSDVVEPRSYRDVLMNDEGTTNDDVRSTYM